jgi:hypothetical protein
MRRTTSRMGREVEQRIGLISTEPNGLTMGDAMRDEGPTPRSFSITRRTLIAALSLVGACGDPEESCNAAKVASADAWRAVQDQLGPACHLFDDPRWAQTQQDGHQGLSDAMDGRATEWDATAATITMCIEAYQPKLRSACREVGEARESATGGAVAARDAADEAGTAIDAVLSAHTEFSSCMRRNERAIRAHVQQHDEALDGLDPALRRTLENVGGSNEWERGLALIEAAGDHSTALAGSDLAARLRTARADAASSFASCQTVTP